MSISPNQNNKKGKRETGNGARKRKIKIQAPKAPRSRPVTNWPVTDLIPHQPTSLTAPFMSGQDRSRGGPVVGENHLFTSHTSIRLTPKELKYDEPNCHIDFHGASMYTRARCYFLYVQYCRYNVRGTVQGSPLLRA